jgi:hypothetical protein
MRNQKLNGMGDFKTAHPHLRSEERPFPNRDASLPSGLSYRGGLMREPCLGPGSRPRRGRPTCSPPESHWHPVFSGWLFQEAVLGRLRPSVSVAGRPGAPFYRKRPFWIHKLLNAVEPLAWLTDALECMVTGRTKAHDLAGCCRGPGSPSNSRLPPMAERPDD